MIQIDSLAVYLVVYFDSHHVNTTALVTLHHSLSFENIPCCATAASGLRPGLILALGVCVVSESEFKSPGVVKREPG